MLSGSCKEHLAPLTPLRASVGREILSRHTTSINIVFMSRLLRVLAIFLLRQPPGLQIFCWMILSKVVLDHLPTLFCIPTSMYSESAYRSKVAKSILGAKYRLSREQHVAEENFLQSPGLEPFWSMSPFESVADLLAKLTSSPLYFFPFGIRCPVLPSPFTW